MGHWAGLGIAIGRELPVVAVSLRSLEKALAPLFPAHLLLTPAIDRWDAPVTANDSRVLKESFLRVEILANFAACAHCSA